MQKVLFLMIVLLTSSVHATCLREVTTCASSSHFLNSYEMESIRCAPPGGPVQETKTFRIYNLLVNDCGPVSHAGCLKPLFENKLSMEESHYFQADLKISLNQAYLLIDDRRIIPQGAVHYSTPQSDYMFLEGYSCSSN